MKSLIAGLCCAVLIVACTTSEHQSTMHYRVPNPSFLDSLHAYMTGDFSSTAQSLADSTYFDITMRMESIWGQDSAGFWLYVEQAASANVEAPYRQRAYYVQQLQDSIFRSDIFLLPNDSVVVGLSGNDAYWQTLTPDSMLLKPACEVYLTLQPDGTFAGSTKGKGCSSTYYGASYATSEVTVAPDLITSWDRGYDSLDVYIWGAEFGPYYFLRSE